jgi:hypothetical protein
VRLHAGIPPAVGSPHALDLAAFLARCPGCPARRRRGEGEEAAEEEHESPEPAEDASEALTAGSVEKAAKDGCSTGAVRGLSLQIIAEANCIEPDAYAPLPQRPNLTVNPNVFAYLEGPARKKLVEALDANPSKRMTINSMLRTVAQQYMLRRWDLAGRCGIKVAAKPGTSNHETGLAIDIDEASSWRSVLTNKGFKWLGSHDPVHFDFKGAGAVDHRGLDVLAFQRLWNRNHPEDPIPEDGDYGSKTEARLKVSPAAGFQKGADCDANSGGDDGGDDGDGGTEPPPEETGCDVCAEGDKLDASCSTCATDVCALDSYCCDVTWDIACVRLAEETAGCPCAE